MAKKWENIAHRQQRWREAADRHPEIFEPIPQAQGKPLELRADGKSHGTVEVVRAPGKRPWWKWF